ncbi:MAG: hypothetical protein JWQ49_3072 [Edaphobacter sp.]|nr:hypothetical protein [Edaphobacter sp.]
MIGLEGHGEGISWTTDLSNAVGLASSSAAKWNSVVDRGTLDGLPAKSAAAQMIAEWITGREIDA